MSWIGSFNCVRSDHFEAFIPEDRVKDIDGLGDRGFKGRDLPSASAGQINAELKSSADIYRRPGNTEMKYQGHTYKKWASFGRIPPATSACGFYLTLFLIEEPFTLIVNRT